MAACKPGPRKITLQSELKRIRVSLGLSTNEVSRRSGLDDSIVSVVEGGRSCRLETLKLIAIRGLGASHSTWLCLRQLWLDHQETECTPGPAPRKR